MVKVENFRTEPGAKSAKKRPFPLSCSPGAQELAAGALYKTNPAKAIELLPLGRKAFLEGGTPNRSGTQWDLN